MDERVSERRFPSDGRVERLAKDNDRLVQQVAKLLSAEGAYEDRLKNLLKALNRICATRDLDTAAMIRIATEAIEHDRRMTKPC